MLVVTDHGIDVFNFALWKGPPPTLVQQNVSRFTKPGAHDIGRQKLGIWGREFDVELTAFFADRATAELRSSQYHTVLPGSGFVLVKYGNVNYFLTHSHVYHVENVSVIEIQQIVRAIGFNYDLSFPFQLTVKMTLTPQFLIPE